MITRIREVRRARGMTLDDVAERCDPPTTPQTIGRLETGTRTVSVGWLNRIAAALGVEAADLVDQPDRAELPVVAILGANGARRAAPHRDGRAAQGRARPGRDDRRGQRRRLSRRRRNLVRAARARRFRPRAQPRRARPPPRRPLPVRPPDRPRGQTSCSSSRPAPAGARHVVTDPPWAAVAVKLVRAL